MCNYINNHKTDILLTIIMLLQKKASVPVWVMFRLKMNLTNSMFSNHATFITVLLINHQYIVCS